MRNFMRNIFTLILVLAFISCSPIIHKGLWKLKKGLNETEVIEIVDDNKKTEVLKIEKSEIIKVTLKSDDINKYSIIIGKKFINFDDQYYVYAFKNNQLIFWGTTLEFARHESPMINEIGEQSIKYIEKDM